MRYYEMEEMEQANDPVSVQSLGLTPDDTFAYRKHIKNAYWCPTREFMKAAMDQFKDLRLVSMCGTLESGYCKDCRNCEFWYWITMKRINELAS
jgi:hypothetical protein